MTTGIDMASPAPHLLSIPREVRDIIYSYLSHEIKFEWVVKRMDTEEKTAVSLRFDNAPLLSVLLTHPQLHTEYLEADCFRDLSIHADLKEFEDFLHDDATTHTNQVIEKALAHVRNISIFVYGAYRDYFWGHSDDDDDDVDDTWGKGEELWYVVEGFVSALESKLPQISTITVAAMQEEYSMNMPQYKLEEDYTGDEICFPQPPKTLIGLTLRRRGQGHRYRYIQTSYSPYFAQPHHTFEEYKAGAWLFSKDKTNKPWAPAVEIVKERPLDCYPRRVLEAMPPEKAEKAARMGEMKEWIEIWDDAVRS